MSITTERMQQLQAEYSELKAQVLTIDDKYTLNYVPPQVDLPDSLGLVHIPFAEKTEQELKALAEQNVKAKYLARKSNLDQRYATKSDAIATKQSELAEQNRRSLAKLLDEFTDGWNDAFKRLTDARLLLSSVLTRVQQKMLVDYNDKVATENTDFSKQKQLLSDEKTALDAKYTQDKSDLETQRAAMEREEYNTLAEKQNKDKLANQKYNASLDEREARYTASCKRFVEQAKQAEYTRKLEASRLLAELGTTGVEQQKQEEKYLVSCNFVLSHWTKEEANLMISSDSFLSEQLGTKYSALQSFVEECLL